MPTETGRVIKRKRVNLPNGSTVDIPVITQITFLDVVAQGQEYEFHIENGAAANRDVHVATVPGGGAATDESGGGGDSDLKVERIDIWRVLDIVDRAQESFIHLDNKTVQEPPDAPPYFTTHEKTHVVKYVNTPDDGNWIKSELIDRFKVLDVVEQGQETEYFLFNPPDNTGISGLTLDTDSDGNPTVAVDPGIAEIADALDPVRTDPFQNIIDFSGELKSYAWLVTLNPVDEPFSPHFVPGAVCSPRESVPPGVTSRADGYFDSFKTSVTADPIEVEGITVLPPVPSTPVLDIGQTVLFQGSATFPNYNVTIGTVTVPAPWDKILGTTTLDALTATCALGGFQSEGNFCGPELFQSYYTTQDITGPVFPPIGSLSIDLSGSFSVKGKTYVPIGCHHKISFGFFGTSAVHQFQVIFVPESSLG